MDDLALVAAHGLEADLLADAARLVREMSREARECLLAARTVVLHVKDDARVAVLRNLVDDEIRKILECVECCTVLADEDAEVLPLHIEDRTRRRIRAVQGNAETHGGKDLAEEFLSGGGHCGRQRHERRLAARAALLIVACIRVLIASGTFAAHIRTRVLRPAFALRILLRIIFSRT